MVGYLSALNNIRDRTKMVTFILHIIDDLYSLEDVG